MSGDVLAKYPQITKLYQAVEGHEKISDWVKAQDK